MKRGAEIAVTGMGCLTAAGPTATETWNAIRTGRRTPAPPKRLQVDLDPPPVVFEIDSDLGAETATALATFGLAPELGEPLTRTSRLGWIAVAEACARAGLSRDALQSHRVGLAIGTTVGCTLNDEAFYRAYRAGAQPGADAPRRYLANNPALHIARALGLRGPSATIDNACSSSADAIDLVALWIRTGLCDIAVAAGADELSRVTILGFNALLITDPEPCRPFDARRRGLNLGEGGAALVLETTANARARNAAPLAHLLGAAAFSDAHHPTAPHPEGRGLRRAIAESLRAADLGPQDIAFVNAHGTATPNNDVVEGRVLAEMLGLDVALSATKAFTGHTLGAAGAIEAVLTIQALREAVLPPAPYDIEPDPDCGVAPGREARAVSGDAAISNSLAFGGANTALVFGKAAPP